MRLIPETIGMPPSDKPLWMRFLGCGPRHHSVALAPIPAPTGLIHLMTETETIDDVGLAMDRCAKNKAQLIATLKKAKIGFIEDPTNRDLNFTRPRIRALMPVLAAEGGDIRNLTRLASRSSSLS